MFCTVLPSAATMPMASTNSGNAMMVSAMRPTMRSVQPPKIAGGDAGEPAHQEDQRHRGDRDDEVEPVATITRLKMSRPSWSVPNQCAADGGFSAAAVSLASGS